MACRSANASSLLVLAGCVCAAHAVVLGADYPAVVRQDRPVSYFRFDEQGGGQPRDSAGAEAETVVTASALVQAVPGALRMPGGTTGLAARFSGNSYVQATADPDRFDFSGAVSIEFWIRPTEGGEGTQCFIAKGEFTRTNCNYYVVYFQEGSGKSGRLRFGIASGYLDQASKLDEDEFTHVVVTFDPSRAGVNTRMYINGRLDAEKHIDGQPRSTRGTPLSIGALLYELPKQPRIQFFVGELDEVAFYPHALSEARVAVHFAQGSPPVVFETEVRPLLQRACFGCHAEKQQGKLDLRTVTAMLRGGESGPAVARGSAAQSLLLERIQFGEMPPPDSGQTLSPSERRLIALWIDGGCRAEEVVGLPPVRALVTSQQRAHWAFQAFAPGLTPPLEARGRARGIRTPVDAFIQSRLARHGLAMSGDVDRMRLARRAFIDLIGLPPPLERIDRFLADPRPDAFARLVDELLSSPQFGVRWGRHWLDIAGYTDTISFDDDYGPPIGFVEGKWRYRDYVIRSFNQDKPYRRFVTEQLAGDELVDWEKADRYTPELIESLVATGYLRCCEDISKEDPRPFIIWSVLHDSVEQIGTSLLGLTLNCARCHSHKFEAIPQRDYYRLMAVLTPALNPANWKDPQQRAVPDVSSATREQIDAHNAQIDGQVKRLESEIAVLRKRHEMALRNAKLAEIPADDRAALRATLGIAEGKRDAQQKALVAKHAAALKVDPQAIDAALTAVERAQIDRTKQSIGAHRGRRHSHSWIHAMYDVGPPPPTRLFQQGSYLHPRREVPPGFPEVLTTADFTSYLEQVRPTRGSGHRLALARWLTDTASPASALVARVMVNRVWSHLMGAPIVATTDNLGASGARPSHPELLDWLSADFRREGSIKRLIRQTMASSVYRQASFGARDAAERARAIDPANRLLWRARLRRVEAEVVRDSMLSAAGQLDRSMGGPPVPLEYRPNGTVLVATKGLPTPSSRLRRSVYLLNRRIYNPSFLSVFDKPIVTGSVCRRAVSAVALQSLSMMNDVFVVEQSQHLAARVAAATDSTDARIDRLFRLTVARSPSVEELDLCRQMLASGTRIQLAAGGVDAPADAALVDLCQTLLNMNEQLYLE